MIMPGEYAWGKNDRYGSNHRVLTLAGPEGAIDRFRFLVTHSAGFMGKDFSVTTGGVRAAGPDALELVAENVEHTTDDGEESSRTFPGDGRRMLFVARKKWWGWRTVFTLDGEPYAPLPPRR